MYNISATCLCLCNSTKFRRPVGKGQKVSADWTVRIADISQFAEYKDLITGKCSMEEKCKVTLFVYSILASPLYMCVCVCVYIYIYIYIYTGELISP